jgi:hypothetical protein
MPWHARGHENSYNIFVGKPERKKVQEGPDTYEMLKLKCIKIGECVHVAQNSHQ